MTMTLTHPEAPGHSAIATETGWLCSCGAGTTWPNGETRPRNRATGGARRHLTAAARNHPDNATPAPAPAPAPGERQADADAIREAARPSLVSQFRSPPTANDD